MKIKAFIGKNDYIFDNFHSMYDFIAELEQLYDEYDFEIGINIAILGTDDVIICEIPW